MWVKQAKDFLSMEKKEAKNEWKKINVVSGKNIDFASYF